MKARDNYVIQLKNRSQEAMQLISASKQAKLQEQLAQTMQSFDLGDDASTFNEMREKIDRRVAAAEAKLQLGTASVDNQMVDIEKEAMEMQLQDKLLAYKQQMGLLGEGSSNDKKTAFRRIGGQGKNDRRFDRGRRKIVKGNEQIISRKILENKGQNSDGEIGIIVGNWLWQI
jgi:phage shock protein A